MGEQTQDAQSTLSGRALQVLSEHRPIKSVAFCPAGPERRPKLSKAFELMRQSERIGFLVRLVALWHDIREGAHREIIDCFGGSIELYLNLPLEFKKQHNGADSYLHINAIGRLGLDVGSSQNNLVILVHARNDPELIEELAAAAHVC